MNVQDAIAQRRSVRSFLDKPVEDDKLMRVLEAGRLAPSASNRQPTKLVVVTDRAKREAVAKAANEQNFIAEAGVVLVACAVQTDRVMLCGQYAYPIDVAICLTDITLAAVDEGLGTCWIGAFHEAQVKEILGIPEEIRVVQLMPLGYPTRQPDPRPRKSMEQFVVFEHWIEHG